MNGPIGPTGAYVLYHAVAERHHEVDTVYRFPITVIHVWDLQRNYTDVLDINAQVSTPTQYDKINFLGLSERLFSASQRLKQKVLILIDLPTLGGCHRERTMESVFVLEYLRQH